jgi:hypothetical protein
MHMKVRMKFNDEERVKVQQFATAVGLDVDTFCKQAVFYTINDAYRRAQEADKNESLNSVHPDSQGDTSNEVGRGSSDSAALSNQTDETVTP